MKSVKELIDFLRKPQKNQKEKKFRTKSNAHRNCIRRIHRRLTLSDHAVIACLHYGSLNDFSKVLHQTNKISEMLRIPQATIQGILKRFKANGFKLVSRRFNCGRREKPKPEELTRWLTSQAGLQECAGLSLLQRCEVIFEKFQFKIHAEGLRKFYKRNGVSYGKAQQVYAAALQDMAGLEHRRQEFAKHIGQLIITGTPIIYIDETTFNTWLRKTHSWQRMEDKVFLKLNPRRIGQCTLYGAIGINLKKPIYHVGWSTNKDDFIDFLRLVKIEVGDDKPVLAYDNHRSHTSVAATEYIRQNFTSLRIPPYSCEFNSIEKLWSQLKSRFKTEMAKLNYEIKTRDQLVKLVLQVAESHPIQQANNTIRANASYIRSVLLQIK